MSIMQNFSFETCIPICQCLEQGVILYHGEIVKFSVFIYQHEYRLRQRILGVLIYLEILGLDTVTTL